MESERLRITLDHPDKVYYAGETINGEIFFNLQKRTKIRSIKVQINGKGKCKWMEILRKESNSDANRSLFYSAKSLYQISEKTVPAFDPNGVELSPGEHTFPFSIDLELLIPSTFKGSYGSIKYKLRLIIQRPWQFDERHVIPLKIIKNMPLPQYLRINPTPLEKQITKTISLFGTRPITMLAVLPEEFAVRGEPMRICVTVNNNSTTTIEKLRFTLLQYVTYYSQQPLRIKKIEIVPLTNKETGAVHKKSERSFAHELLVPETAQPTDVDFGWCIHIQYELRVEAVLRGFFKNLLLNLPFTMYSHDALAPQAPANMPPQFDDNSEQSNNTSSGAGNPFETTTTNNIAVNTTISVNNMMAYPALDTSIGSPSRSSQYSESSSINSITSDSSTATLSPAIGGGGNNTMELSYTSGTSSLYNSPSARASLRSSNVPYMPYSTSPLMINSYPPSSAANNNAPAPPYRLAESPEYTLIPSQQAESTPTSQTQTSSSQSNSPAYMPMALPTTLPTSIFQLPTTSTRSFLQRQPPGAHELPPSYEELFGSATAPPPFDDTLPEPK